MTMQEIIVLILIIVAVSFLGYRLYKSIIAKSCEDDPDCHCDMHGIRKQIDENHKNS